MIETPSDPPAPPPANRPESDPSETLVGALLPIATAGADALDPQDITAQLAALSRQAARYAERASGDGTRRAYGAAWTAYAAWCQKLGLEPLGGDPGIVALYLTARAQDGLSVSSLGVARAAIRARHRMAQVPLDLDDPRVTLVMRGITNAKGKTPQTKSRPRRPGPAPPHDRYLPVPRQPGRLGRRARRPPLRHAADRLRRGPPALRADRARRGRRHPPARPRPHRAGQRAKSDQQGEGRLIAIHANPTEPDFCPAIAFARWMDIRAAGLDWTPPPDQKPERWRAARPLFCGIGKAGTLKGQTMADLVVARLLKQAARQAGLDPARFSGHSLRRGLLTDAGDRREQLRDVMRQSRHVKVENTWKMLRFGATTSPRASSPADQAPDQAFSLEASAQVVGHRDRFGGLPGG
jgi:hypothetical protein